MELPDPTDDPEAINQAIKHHGIFFYHARFSHEYTAIPFGYYPRNEAVALSELTRGDGAGLWVERRAAGQGPKPLPRCLKVHPRGSSAGEHQNASQAGK